MNGKHKINQVVQNVADGIMKVENATELLVQIFGDEYDEGRALVIASLNPPAVVESDEEFDDNVIHYDFGGEG